MCGISGFNFEDEKKVAAMNAALAHRGPDGEDVLVKNGVSLGHRRLAILDVSQRGAQPMHYKHLTIVHNGEVYNYLELREELEACGHSFTTETDTEVILAAFNEWGSACVERFNGMWAFCIYDEKENMLFLSRDRFGVKPLYYYLKDGVFVFASEIKAILAHRDSCINTEENIDLDALELYFSLGYIPSPYSIYTTVRKLPAAHSMVFNLAKREVQQLWQYYTLPTFIPQNDKEALVQEGKELLTSATQLRMRSDVPVGSFLSGGLDSTAVTGAMAQFAKDSTPHTFSVEFTGTHNETEYIEAASKHIGTHHHSVTFKDDEFGRILERYSLSYDEPFGDYAGFPTLTVSELARQHVTVALSGDGGDEVFGGYTKYVMGAQMEVLYKIPRAIRALLHIAFTPFGWIAKVALLRKALALSFLPKEEFYARATETFGYSGEAHKKFVQQHMEKALELSNGNLAEAMRVYDSLAGTLPDHFLTKVDRASMAYGLEVRSPFLDYRFLEYAQRIPTKWKQNSSGKTKILMREIIRGIVPEHILNRGKSGFTPPLDWIASDAVKADLKEGLEILKDLCPGAHAWYKKNLHDIKKDHTEERIRKDRIMWLYLFTLWYKQWIK